MAAQRESTDRAGRFVVTARLSSSDVRDVFFAQDTLNGREVVLKRARGRARDAIVREHDLLARLSPELGEQVPELIAAGLSDAEPWFAMARAHGLNLREYKHKLWQLEFSRGPGGSADALSAEHVTAVTSIALALAAALARLHANGVVHADLSPENVLMTPEGRLMLLDFESAARLFDVSDRQRAGASRLTPGYAAPEVLRGDPFDCRADLYSWACIVRELLLGVSLFSGATAAVLARLHLDAPAKPATSVRAGVPSWLDALLLTLLEKEPRQRRMPACSLSAELAQRTGRAAPTWRDAGPPPLNRPSFIGRHAELRQLRARLEGAAAGSGGAILVRAAAGLGKSALLDELARRARALGFRVLWAAPEVTPLTSGPSLGGSVLARLIAEHALARGVPSSPDVAGGPLSAHLESLQAWLPDLLTHGIAPPREALPADAARRRALRSLAELLHALGAAQPLLVLLDDLHAADELSIEFLASRESDALRATRVLVVATVTGPRPGTPFDEVAARALDVVDLGGLDLANTLQFVEELLGTSVIDGSFGTFLHEHCDGNPFFVTQVVRLARARELLRFDPELGWALSEPRAILALRRLTLEETLGQRLQPLAQPARQVAAVAAVIGRHFHPPELHELLQAASREPCDPKAELAELVRHDILTPIAGGYSFVHETVRAACELALSEDQRHALHTLLAERLTLESSHDERIASVIAHHWTHAGRPERAVPFLVRAAEQLAASFEPHRAIAAARLALEHLSASLPAASPWPEDVLRVAQRLLGLYGLTAQHQLLSALAEQLLERTGPSDWRAQCETLIVLARSCRVTSDYAAASGHLDRAERLLRQRRRGGRGDVAQWLDVQDQRVWLLYMKRDVQAIGPVLQRMAPVVRSHGTAIQLASFYMWSANDLVLQNQYQFSPTAVEHERRGLSLLENAAALPQLAMTEFDLAFMLLLGNVHRCEEACSHLERARSLAEKLGDPVLAARAATYLAIAERRLGRVTSGEGWARVALEEARASGIRGYIGAAHACLGWAAWRRDEVNAALESFSAAREAWWHRRGDPKARSRDEFPFQWLAHLPLLLVHTSRDELEPAAAALDELLAEPQQRLVAPVHEQLIRLERSWSTLSPRGLEDELRELTRRAAQQGYV
jgi:tetratricopeptide (TPR) repeat protein